MTELTERAKIFHTAISDFIEARRKAKEKEKNFDPQKYDYVTWLSDASSRAHNLRVVTHPIKFIHSAIKGATSIYFSPEAHIPHYEVGTHLLNKYEEDFAITDAKHLDVYSLLTSVIIDGKRLVEWVVCADRDLLLALHQDQDIARAMLSDFNRIIQHDSNITTSSLAKQIYWLYGEDPTDDHQYHLLQPMFSSSLEEEIHNRIKSSKEVMFNARGTSKQVPTFVDHHTYPGLVGRNFGGSNAQNVSPKNKARGGVNYLLSSLPPKWIVSNRIKLLRVDSALSAFRWFEDVPTLLKALSEFLLSNPDQIKETREKREALEQALGEQLALFGESIRLSQEPGWTRNPACQLPQCEKLWLDPERIELPVRETHQEEDVAFNAAFTWGDWPDQVASRFANWLNNYLADKGLVAVGDAEYRHWAKQAVIGEVNWPILQQRRATGGDV